MYYWSTNNRKWNVDITNCYQQMLLQVKICVTKGLNKAECWLYIACALINSRWCWHKAAKFHLVLMKIYSKCSLLEVTGYYDFYICWSLQHFSLTNFFQVLFSYILLAFESKFPNDDCRDVTIEEAKGTDMISFLTARQSFLGTSHYCFFMAFQLTPMVRPTTGMISSGIRQPYAKYVPHDNVLFPILKYHYSKNFASCCQLQQVNYHVTF